MPLSKTAFNPETWLAVLPADRAPWTDRDCHTILELWLVTGQSPELIAKAVGRAKSTVSRELRRNALPSGRYSPLYAAGAYQRRRRRDAILERDRRLRDFVCDRLAADDPRGRERAGVYCVDPRLCPAG